MPRTRPPLGADARPTLATARDLLAAGEWLESTLADARGAVVGHHRALAHPQVAERLRALPVERLREAAPGLRTAGLREAGYGTVWDVVAATPGDLDALEGVGPQRAQALSEAATQVARAVNDSVQVRLTEPAASGLVVSLVRLADLARAAKPLRQLVAKVVPALRADLPATEPVGGWFRWWFAGAPQREAATAAWTRVDQVVGWARENRVADLVGRVREVADREVTPVVARERLTADASGLQSLLAETVELRLDLAAAEGYLPAEIVAAIDGVRLDDSLLDVTLRGYQSFGARFALVQRRVVVGDEMGLGKTVQAIAAMAHLASSGATHFVVVCPASVVVNWVRELGSRSKLTAVRLHGDDRGAELARWLAGGGVAVTTFETLAALEVPDAVRPALLVVDEAHYVKNPASRRARLVHHLGVRCERVLYLTGTPMENDVEEFRNLVGVLAPAAEVEVERLDALAGPAAFRAAVAPVYLRRNAADVLGELPELVQTDEWEEFTASDAAAYADAVRSGNFSLMRRAAYASGDPRTSAKLARLLELCNEARKNGRKVVVFSFFLGVLATVHSALEAHGFTAFGPLTGATPPEERQRLVDAFTQASGSAVFVGQIAAAGVGLNLQAASVVILCEPQLKPTSEAQAIARAHRMGQLETVLVHRLLVADSVDERLLELLAHKEALFDAFARESTLADASPAATSGAEVSEVSLARRVVAAEQGRLSAAPQAVTRPAVTALSATPPASPAPAPRPPAGP